METGASMSRINIYAFAALAFAVLVPAQANAFGACLKDHKPFHLTGDSIEYSMTIAPGAECIQGLRWSFMQVYTVWVLKEPKHGELVMVGPGFRYQAKPEFSGTDKFSLVVVGKNRHEEGFSTVEVTVSRQDPPPKVTAVDQLGSALAQKLADAAAVQ
jgi:hypothetical protein